MLVEIIAEILKLSSDFKFVRNLSCTSMLAIACLFSLSDLQRESNLVSPHNSPTNMQLETKYSIERRMN